MERLLLYVHFNKFNQISEHVLYQLEKMRPLFRKVIFISNSKISQDQEDELKQELVDEVLLRKNIGFDFAAWRDGMKKVGFEELKKYDDDDYYGEFFNAYEFNCSATIFNFIKKAFTCPIYIFYGGDSFSLSHFFGFKIPQ